MLAVKYWKRESRDVFVTIKIKIFNKRINILDKILAISREKAPNNILIYPYMIMIPAIGTANILEIIKVKDMVLNSSSIIGIIKICAAMVTDIPFEI